MAANQVFTGVLKQLREEGKDVTQHKKAIQPSDMSKLYSSGVLSNDNPTGLQNKVYVELSLHFGRRGREGLRQLTKDSILIKEDDSGREYATLAYNEKDKNHQLTLPKEGEKQQIMYSQPDSELCPVKSLKKYLSKLNLRCDALFQRAKPKIDKEDEDVWFENKCLGVHKLESLMKTISKEAKLSEIYTNHCLRATTSTILSDAGIENRKICAVTGHKNETSLQSYIKQPSLHQRAQMCDILHAYGKQEKTPVMSTVAKPNATPTATITKTLEASQLKVQSTTSQVQIDTTSAVFAGANFSGPTSINVMINQNK
jgi:hypothetical protein